MWECSERLWEDQPLKRCVKRRCCLQRVLQEIKCLPIRFTPVLALVLIGMDSAHALAAFTLLHESAKSFNWQLNQIVTLNRGNLRQDTDCCGLFIRKKKEQEQSSVNVS